MKMSAIVFAIGMTALAGLSQCVETPSGVKLEKDGKTVWEFNIINPECKPFIHPLTAAVDPAWESRSDWAIIRSIAKKFSDVAPEVLGVC